MIMCDREEEKIKFLKIQKNNYRQYNIMLKYTMEGG